MVNPVETLRRTGNFLPGGGGGKPCAQKILASCPNVYETVEKKRGQTMQQRRPYWHMKVARYCNSFSGSIPPNFEHIILLEKDKNLSLAGF